MIVKAVHIAVVSAHPPIKMVVNRKCFWQGSNLRSSVSTIYNLKIYKVIHTKVKLCLVRRSRRGNLRKSGYIRGAKDAFPK